MKTYREPTAGYELGIYTRSIIRTFFAMCKFVLMLAVMTAVLLSPYILEALIF